MLQVGTIPTRSMLQPKTDPRVFAIPSIAVWSPLVMSPSAPSSRMKYSQNFLRSKQVVAVFGDALTGGDLCVEVGAGDGALTGVIAARYERVLAYEIDPLVCRRLAERGVPRNVELREANILNVRPPRERFDVASNVPFGITSQIVRWCLEADSLRQATLITELAYARKRTGDYGRWSKLTVETFPWYEWSLLERIARTAFRPMPSVDAALIRLVRREVPLVSEAYRSEWGEFVGLGFSGRGGSLYRSLKPVLGAHARKRFQAAGIGLDAVVAFVPPEAWLQLFAPTSAAGPQPSTSGRRQRSIAGRRGSRRGRGQQ